ncbi:MAG: DUF3179 domain-containing protein [Anaerolineae bacterium]|nr:DUF3179 domain-containing protein [Anaerolineae bacterium]
MNGRVIGILVVLLVLVGAGAYLALSFGGNETTLAAEVDPPESVAEEVAITEAEEEPVVEEAASPAKQVTILTEDDRPNQLVSATQGWNTNFNKHTIPYDELLSGGPPRDGIPSIDDPKFISTAEAGEWLADNEPVISLVIEDDARAYPLQVLTWHEIVNDTVADVPVAVTFCPLCNSAITFDRRFDGQVFEFGTSGLLRKSDLVMYDRTTETLWQQFTGEGIVGDLAGEQLTFIPSSLISFADFKAAHPDGVVLSRDTGFSRRYGENPYVGYDSVGSNPFLFRGEIDGRLSAMERVVTISFADDPNLGITEEIDVAYPLTTLAEAGVINDTQAGVDLAFFHQGGTASALGARVIADAEDVGSTGVFNRELNGQTLSFKKEGDLIIDEETGSTWNILGTAIDGPLAGEQLSPILHADHFWFSWAAFKPDTIIYSQ